MKPLAHCCRRSPDLTLLSSNSDQDTPSLLVVDVTAESPAEKQGVRLGSRLAKINGMHVDAGAETVEVQLVLGIPNVPWSLTFGIQIRQQRYHISISI